jgi:hypothetical protein
LVHEDTVGKEISNLVRQHGSCGGSGIEICQATASYGLVYTNSDCVTEVIDCVAD